MDRKDFKNIAASAVNKITTSINKIIAGIIVIIMLIVFYFIYKQGTAKETFANEGEKAEIIYQWFKNNARPTYNKYRADLASGSNIVEYEDAMQLQLNNKLTLDSIKTII